MSKQVSLFGDAPRTLTISRRISTAEIEAAMTPRGGWTRATLAQWGVPWPPPKGWRRALEIKPLWTEVAFTRSKDLKFAEAMAAARDIREWTDGPRPARRRVRRLAQALKDG